MPHPTTRAFARGLASGVALAATAAAGRKALAVLRGGHGHPVRQRVLDVASALVQPKRPLGAVSTCLNGFHFYADDLGRQVEATHLCSHRRDGLHQCVIYDSGAEDARLIGVEYIVSAERFAALPAQEQRLWHSHDHEVRSGSLVAPGAPQVAEHAHLEHLVSTYGKTFHTWQYDRDEEVPLGPPQLMMAFTAEGQERSDLLAARDRRLGTSVSAKRRNRADIAPSAVHPAADAWQSGTTPQLRLVDVPVRRP